MTPQELKSSILQLAVQGRLVEQRPEEGTAEKLYRQIQEEKQRLIKEGKIKKEKPLPEITEDEVPFDIPESWKWVRLGNLSSLITKGTTPRGGSVSYLDSGVGFLRAENIAGLDKLDKSTLKYVDYETHGGFLRRSIIFSNDVLITIAGTLGRTALVRDEDIPLNANQAVAIVRLCDVDSIDLLFLINALNASKIQKYLNEQRKVTAIPNLTLVIIENCLIPLPPLAEQKRIVAKIEELLPYIDRYEKAWSKLEDFNKRFPGDMQKSVLQMAIQGKLVEQRPEEGAGEELYTQIQAEKQSLIKAGKIKKEKPLPEISDDEIPFDIPESWKWVRLSDIANMCLGKMLDKAKNKGKLHPYLRNVNVRWGCFDLSDLLEMRFEEDETEKYSIRFGDLVVCEGGEPGRCAVWDDKQSTIRIQKALHRIRFYGEINSFFIYRVFEFYASIGFFARRVTGTTIKHLPGAVLAKILIPLPSLAEQKRIVQKLEEILPLCDKLK